MNENLKSQNYDAYLAVAFDDPLQSQTHCNQSNYASKAIPSLAKGFNLQRLVLEVLILENLEPRMFVGVEPY